MFSGEPSRTTENENCLSHVYNERNVFLEEVRLRIYCILQRACLPLTVGRTNDVENDAIEGVGATGRVRARRRTRASPTSQVPWPTAVPSAAAEAAGVQLLHLEASVAAQSGVPPSPHRRTRRAGRGEVVTSRGPRAATRTPPTCITRRHVGVRVAPTRTILTVAGETAVE